MLRNVSYFIFFFILLSCGSTYKKNPERIIYTNEVVEIIGKDAGLPEYVKNITLYISNSIGFEREFYLNFDKRINYYIESYGIKIGKNLEDAGLLNISIDRLITNEMIINTNFYNILYALELSFSLYENKTKVLQKDKKIKEYVLVFDTNRYNDEYVLSYLADLSAKHIAQCVKFGWQEDFSKTADKIIILGGLVETNNITNRRK